MRSKAITIALMAASAWLAEPTLAVAQAPTSLAALTVAPDPVIPLGTLHVRGSGCVGSGGTPGVVTITVQTDGGSSTSSTTDVDAYGGFVQTFTAPATAGSYAVAATCDLYGQSIPYPAASYSVAASGASGPVDPNAGAQPPVTGGGAGASAGAPGQPTGVPAPAAPSGEAADAPPAGSPGFGQIPSGSVPGTGVPALSLGTTALALLISGAAAAVAGRRRTS